MSIYCWKKWNLKSYKCKIHMDGENVKNAKKLNFQNLIQVIHHLWKHSYQHTNKYKMGICTVKLSPIMAYQIISNKIQKSFGHSHVPFNHIIFPMSSPNIDILYIYTICSNKISFCQWRTGHKYIYFCTQPHPIPFSVSLTLVNSVNICWKVALITIKQLSLSLLLNKVLSH